MSIEKNIKTDVNDVLEDLINSRNGYKECAAEVADTRMKQLFQRLANQRESMIQELKTRIQFSGVEPTDSGSMTAAAHRTFIDIKSMLTGGDTDAIVNEVKRGEHHTLEQFKDALSEDIPADLKQLLSQQMHTIETNLAEIDMQANTTGRI
jgi:uncharacterized protein (TIGR02284 family)